ncbi:hypothetical protein EVAR_68251_1 [Eumeta japonica]|uniref:Uncharacterized protein n=1 Tax=Eumeta variegata TaxID=151549 RepID=A0A4C1ZUW7_EUMVA|nr:hypothetical protein EVAR_68251_1 [Eumeta japonica]
MKKELFTVVDVKKLHICVCESVLLDDTVGSDAFRCSFLCGQLSREDRGPGPRGYRWTRIAAHQLYPVCHRTLLTGSRGLCAVKFLIHLHYIQTGRIGSAVIPVQLYTPAGCNSNRLAVRWWADEVLTVQL